jgi:hypothetical protein
MFAREMANVFEALFFRAALLRLELDTTRTASFVYTPGSENLGSLISPNRCQTFSRKNENWIEKAANDSSKISELIERSTSAATLSQSSCGVPIRNKLLARRRKHVTKAQRFMRFDRHAISTPMQLSSVRSV